jgi:proline dehydrogenase
LVNPLKTFLRNLAGHAARSYVVGPHLSDAMAFVHDLEREGLRGTIGYWNDVGDDPAEVHAAYLAAIDAAAEAKVQTSVSIKAPALSLSGPRIASLVERCRQRHVGLHFDALTVEHQGPLFDLIEQLGIGMDDIGCTLPARFGRSLADVERAVSSQLRVRVVKGQWPDPAHAMEPRRGFMAVIDRLAGRARHVGVATHDAALAEEALRRLGASGTPAELELLFGLPMRATRDVARRLNVPVRVYVPYGHAWLPYALSSARTNPRVLWWLLGDAIRARMPGAHRRL